jgi:hypothetical protein
VVNRARPNAASAPSASATRKKPQLARSARKPHLSKPAHPAKNRPRTRPNVHPEAGVAAIAARVVSPLKQRPKPN